MSDYFVQSQYSGDVIDHNDIAVLRLSDLAPTWAASYGLFTNTDLGGRDFTVTGYGRLGDGATGANNFTSRLRTGENTYDFRLGDSLFGGGWNGFYGPDSKIGHSWLSDFDSGLAANDASCRVANASNWPAANGSFCDLGVGAREAGVASGDSGGGAFIDGLLSSVNSYGLTFGPGFGDTSCGSFLADGTCRSYLNSSFGEFSGYVPVYLHADWITSLLVPEPGSIALLTLGLMGLGATRRARQS